MFKSLRNKHAYLNDVATDVAYFIPGVGIYVGGDMTVGKEVVELGI